MALPWKPPDQIGTIVGTMRSRAPTLILAILATLPAMALAGGCVDSQGNRVSMQNWLSSPPAEKKESPAPGTRGQADAGEKQLARSSATRDADDASSRRRDSAGGADGSRGGTAPSPPAPAKEPPRIRVEMVDEAADAAEESAPPKPAASPNAIHSDVLLINKETISVNDILEPISPELEKLSGEVAPNIYFGRATELIRQQIIEAVAQLLVWRKAQSTINEEMEKSLMKAVDKMEKDRINREFQGRETLYDKYLARHGKTRDQVRERLRKSIVIDSYLRERLLPLVPNPRKQELLSYYNANLGEFTRPGRREMFLIEVPISAFLKQQRSPGAGELQEATEKARAEIEAAAAALEAGEPFEEVAKRVSRGPNAQQGGAWGFIESPLKGRWEVPSKQLFQLKEGQTGTILEAAKSFFIVKAGKVENRQIMDFNEAQPQIANILKQRRFNKLRADFLQEELKQSTLGSLDEFVAEVLRAVPDPKVPAR